MSRVGVDILEIGRSRGERFVTVKITMPNALANTRDLGAAVTEALIEAAHVTMGNGPPVYFTTSPSKTDVRVPCDGCGGVESVCNCSCGSHFCGCTCHR